MTANGMKHRLPLAAVIVAVALLTMAHTALAATPPVKEILSSQIGSEVNKATKGKICLVATEECQPARPSSEPGGFEYAAGVAVNGDKASPQAGHVYVIDRTHRVQELAADGSFVSMFGKEVNATTKGDICTAASKDVCQPGVEGSAPGQFGERQESIAIDPVDGAVYVTELIEGSLGGTSAFGRRVQKFTAEGVWVLEIGKEVNETKDKIPGATAEEKDVCTQEEVKVKGMKCGAPAEYHLGSEPQGNSSEPGVFPNGGPPVVVAVGGLEDLLYVGAGARVQEFTAAGTFKGQIPLTGMVGAMALDDSCSVHEPVLSEPACASFDSSYGDLYVAYDSAPVVHKFNPGGVQLTEFPLSARSADATNFSLFALAVDPAGRLALSESETIGHKGNSQEFPTFGSLLDGATGRVITEFPILGGIELHGLAFSASDGLYGAAFYEVLSYTPVPVAELLTSPAPCVAGPESETDATYGCTLNGEVNPEEVANTEVSFQWGPTPALAEQTPVQILCTATCPNGLSPVTPAVVSGLRPNETVFYRLAGHDQNVKAPELLTSDTASFSTPVVAPRIVSSPSAPFVGSSSAVMFSELNPENAPTEYFFEYAPKLAGYCEGALRTAALRSAVYGKVGVTLEASGLQPATTYQYRLCASDAAGTARDEHGGSEVREGAFTTAPSPVPQAVTGAYGAITTTSATVSGTVNPDGQPATYAFEMGVSQGAATQYGVVFSGSAGASTTPVEQALALTGLQPGTTYAYRIKVASGYGTAYGATETFTTAGLPSVLVTPTPFGLLAIPNIAFPTPVKATSGKKAKKRTHKPHKKGKTHKRKPHKGKK